jgi:hypothetical protein
MRSQLTPLDTGPSVIASSRPSGSYALLTKDRTVALARAMPDCQSAVLTCLAWQASLHERMHRGQFAGRPVASLSGNQLHEMTGRPLRSVWYALQRLSERHLVVKSTRPGRMTVYELPCLSVSGPEPTDLKSGPDETAMTA